MARDKKQKARAPTSEHQRHFDFVMEAITERGQIIGHAYRRRPLFETMFARSEISKEELQALRFFRERFEQSNRSATRSCLDVTIGGGGGNGPVVPMTTRARSEYEYMLTAAGLFSSVLRQSAIEDMSFNRIAMNRYGCIEVPIGGKNPRSRLVPKSKQHARRVRSEFVTALGLFLPAAQSLFSVNSNVDSPTHARHTAAIPGNARRTKAVVETAASAHR